VTPKGATDADALPPTVDRLLSALLRSVDPDLLKRELRDWLDASDANVGEAHVEPGEAVEDGREGEAMDVKLVLSKIVLSDMLDDSILAARQGDKAYPLRLLLGQLASSLEDDVAFAFACGLNFYFRAPMVEEEKVRVGFEVSRLFYRMARQGKLDSDLTPRVAPLLADLLSTELSKLRFESVDHAPTFDSRSHEREEGSSATSAKVSLPASFIVLVSANKMVRIKAQVWT